MMSTIYWISVLVIILTIFLIALIVKHVKHDADMFDTVILAVFAVLITAFGIPLVVCLLNMHDPVKVTITEVDGTVTELTTERYLVSDGDNRYRIYNKDDDNWVEYHNVKYATLEYLEK